MTAKKTCEDALYELSNITQLNANIQTDYDNRRAALQVKQATLVAQRDAINVPSRKIVDYTWAWSAPYYGCDGDRYNGHKTQCNDSVIAGFSAGSYEWNGTMRHNWGTCLGGYSGCCETLGKCTIKQSTIDALANDAQSKKDALDAQINQVINEINAIKPNFLPVPNISCCQSINLNNISAQTVTFDEMNQQCVVPAPSVPTTTTNPSVPSVPSTPTVIPNTTTSTSHLGIFLFIIFFIVMILIGLGVYIFADDLGLGSSKTN